MPVCQSASPWYIVDVGEWECSTCSSHQAVPGRRISPCLPDGDPIGNVEIDTLRTRGSVGMYGETPRRSDVLLHAPESSEYSYEHWPSNVMGNGEREVFFIKSTPILPLSVDVCSRSNSCLVFTLPFINKLLSFSALSLIPSMENTASAMETPLLVREEDQTTLIEFWSPTRRPPRAPPSSPKISACHILDKGHSDSSSRYRTLAYLNQQLEFEKPYSSPHNFPIDRMGRCLRCFVRTQCSSDDDDRPEADMHHNRLRCEDDGLTLLNPSSSLPSNTSEVNTLSGLSRDSDCESIDLWIESSPKYPFSFHKPWMSTLPTHESFPKANKTGRRHNAPKIDTGVHRVSCPSQARPGPTTSPSTRNSTGVGPALDESFSDSTCERSQVSFTLYSLSFVVEYTSIHHLCLFPFIDDLIRQVRTPLLNFGYQ